MERVYITGLGVVSSLGLGHASFWRALCEGHSGARELSLFDTSTMDRHIACEVPNFNPADFLTRAECTHTGRCSAFALAAARMAVEHAELKPEHLRGERCSVILGTTMGDADILGELESSWFHEGEGAIDARKILRYGSTLLPIHVARALGAQGMVQTLPAACAAGNYAIGFAADQIRQGQADIVVTGASEIIERLQFAGFVRLGAMAPQRCQPFDRHRKGLLLGEGAGLLILESESHLLRRQGVPLAEVGGYGLACDAHHITRPHPEGVGSEKAMREAIAASGVQPEDIDFINAHGTGTQANDPVEAKVIRKVFGERSLPVTSIKSMLGHCMGAASALEAVSCVLSLDDDRLPPTMHLDDLDPECPLDIVANESKDHRVDIVLNNSLAFGGYDAVTCLAKPDRLPPVVYA